MDHLDPGAYSCQYAPPSAQLIDEPMPWCGSSVKNATSGRIEALAGVLHLASSRATK